MKFEEVEVNSKRWFCTKDFKNEVWKPIKNYENLYDVSNYGRIKRKIFINRMTILNKEKIYAYVVSIMTIVTIFFMSRLINSDLKETEVTSSNSLENNAIGEAISTSTPYNVNEDTDDNKSNDSIEENNIKESSEQ